MIELLHIKFEVLKGSQQMAKKLIFKVKSEAFAKVFHRHQGAKGWRNYLLLYQPSSL